MPAGDRAAPRAGVEVEDLALPAGGGGHLELRIFRPRIRPTQIGVLVLVCTDPGDPARGGGGQELARALSQLLDRAVVLLGRGEARAPVRDAVRLCDLCAWILAHGGERGLAGERLSLVLVGPGADALCAEARQICTAMGTGEVTAVALDRVPRRGDAASGRDAAAIAHRLEVAEATGGQP